MATTPTYEQIVIEAAGLTDAYSVSDRVHTYQISADGAAVTLVADVIITADGTPEINTTYTFLLTGGITKGANAFSIFGRSLSAAQVLYRSIVICTWNGSTWDIFILTDMTSGQVAIDGANIVAGSILNAALAGSIALNKLAVAGARGYIMRSGVNGIFESTAASTNGTFVGGNGTDVGPLTMSGDATLNLGVITIANLAVTTAKINDGAVTAAKLSTELKTLNLSYRVSFETGYQGPYNIPLDFAGSVTNIYAQAIKAIAATDNGTIVLKNDAGVDMTVTTPIEFVASDPRGTSYNSAITSNNTFLAGAVISLTTAKTTAGGEVLVTLTIVRS